MAKGEKQIIVMPQNSGLVAAGVVAVAGGGVSIYVWDKYQSAVKVNGGPYVNTSGSSGFWAWLFAGMPATWGNTPPPPGKPAIASSTYDVSVSSGFLGNSYTPSTITLTASGFSPSGNVIVFANNMNIGTSQADSSGNANIQIDASAFGGTSGTWSIYVLDSATNVRSNAVQIIYSLQGSGTSTTDPGYILPKSQWTGQGQYGSNTNPVAFSNWAVNNGTYWGAQSSGTWALPGYYQTASGGAEFYAYTSSDLVAYLQSAGYQTIPPAATGLTMQVSQSVSSSGDNVTITLTLAGSTISSVSVNWGDGGVSSPAPSGTSTQKLSHNYTTAGQYTINVSVADAAYIAHTAYETFSFGPTPGSAGTITVPINSGSGSFTVDGNGFGSSSNIEILANNQVVGVTQAGPAYSNPAGTFIISIVLQSGWVTTYALDGIAVIQSHDVTLGLYSNTVSIKV